jgi:hypothetical protein
LNAYKHAEISVKKRGGQVEDYYKIHEFIDCTKSICSDNRHRILHTMWGVNYIVIPIFGHTIINSDNKKVNVKDLCEQDHILPDYHNRFIPTLNDFVEAIEFDIDIEWKQKIEKCFKIYKEDREMANLLLSPLNITGSIKSLVLTHNSWFLNFIIPKILQKEFELREFEISISEIFNIMKFELWMDNGVDIPNSCKNISSNEINSI